MSVDLIVEGQPGRIHGTLRCGGVTVPCSVGRSGLARDKHEGDGATPVGRFAIRRLLYRADRLPKPVTKLPVSEIAQDDGWCDDMAHPQYNQQVKLPFAASHEELWRADNLYDLIVVLGHNDTPVIPGLGSAVFLHVRARDGGATAGCVAIARDDLLAVLREVDTGSFIDIRTV
ncbi:MAG: L,D-transpeptidase family protein [Rhodospirillaceae bacterium]|nr:L,D-transpeptidase family protein [Rhodospirillaceae bacterium]